MHDIPPNESAIFRDEDGGIFNAPPACADPHLKATWSGLSFGIFASTQSSLNLSIALFA